MPAVRAGKDVVAQIAAEQVENVAGYFYLRGDVGDSACAVETVAVARLDEQMARRNESRHIAMSNDSHRRGTRLQAQLLFIICSDSRTP